MRLPAGLALPLVVAASCGPPPASLGVVKSGGPMLAAAAAASHADHGAVSAAPSPAPRFHPAGPVAGCSTAPSLAFDEGGRLWAAWEEGGRVWVSSSADRGVAFTAAAAVNATPEPIEAGRESRPKLAVGRSGQIWVTWTRRLDKPHTGVVRFSRSEDGGLTFQPPRTLGDDPGRSGQRFDTLLADPSGRLTVAWIDKRDRTASRDSGEDFEGASLYFCESADGGRTFGPSRMLAQHVCECCRLAGTLDAAGRPVLMWRHAFDGSVRDHAVLAFVAPGVPGDLTRASFDGWRVQGCPHHGPAVTVDPRGALHMVWWSGGGSGGRGIFYSRSDGGTPSPAHLVSNGPQAGRPAVLATLAAVWVAWLESDEDLTHLMLARSTDGGLTFPPAARVLATPGAPDHPALVRDRGRAVLAWFTEPEGLRLVDLEPIAH
jgi:hypothetical protein